MNICLHTVHLKSITLLPPPLLTLRLKESLSSKVIVSALAITGTMLTQLCNRFMNSTSRGFRLGIEGAREGEGEGEEEG